MRITPFEPTHLDSVVALSLRAWAPVFESMRGMLGEAVFVALYPDWRVSQREAVENACHSTEMRAWVAMAPEGTLGFVVVKQHAEADMGEVYMVAVDPDAQRRGVGRALSEFGMARLKEAGSRIIMIGTGGDPGHAPAHALYERLGLRPMPLVQYYGEL